MLYTFCQLFVLMTATVVAPLNSSGKATTKFVTTHIINIILALLEIIEGD